MLGYFLGYTFKWMKLNFITVFEFNSKLNLKLISKRKNGKQN